MVDAFATETHGEGATRQEEVFAETTLDFTTIKPGSWQVQRAKYADKINHYDRLSLEDKKRMIADIGKQADVLFDNAMSAEEDQEAEDLRQLVPLLREVTPELRCLHLANLDEVLHALEGGNPNVERMWYRGVPVASFKNLDFVRKVREREASGKLGEYADPAVQVFCRFVERNERKRMLAEYEPYIAVAGEYQRLTGIRWALDDNYMYYLVEKYKGLTREDLIQREKELMHSPVRNEETRREEMGLHDYPVALFHASVPFNAKGGLLIEPDTKEYAEVKRATEEMGKIQGWVRFAMVSGGDEDLMRMLHRVIDIRDGAIRIPPDTEEYRDLRKELDGVVYRSGLTAENTEQVRALVEKINQMAKTNTPTSVIQLPKDAEERLQKYPKRNVERQRQLRRLLHLIDMP